MNTDAYILISHDEKPLAGFDGYPQCAVIRHQGKEYGFQLRNVGCVTFSSRLEGKPMGEIAGQDLEHRHAVYHLVLYLESQDFFKVNGEVHPAEPGVLVITSPKISHSFVPSYRRPTAYTEIAFEVSGPEGFLEIPFYDLLSILFGGSYETPGFPIHAGKRQHQELADQIQVLVRELTESRKRFTGRVALQFLGILNFLAEEFFIPTKYVKSLLAPGPLELARLEIERRYNEPLSIAELADIAALSPNYFLLKFRQNFKLTPIQFQQDLRLTRAKNLLEKTNLSCKEISAQTGYHDLFFFSKIFKKVTGSSPTYYRKERKKQ